MPLQKEKQKGKGNSLAEEQKTPNGSAASLPGDSQAAPVIYEAGGGGGSLSLEYRPDPHPSLGDPEASPCKALRVVGPPDRALGWPPARGRRRPVPTSHTVCTMIESFPPGLSLPSLKWEGDSAHNFSAPFWL